MSDQSLPHGWELAELEAIADVNPRLDKSGLSDELLVSFVPMSAVEARTGAIDVTQTRPFGEVEKGYTPFGQGDVLFAKITPCMENGKMAVVPALRNDLGFGSTEFHVLRPRDGISSEYLYYYTSSEAFRRNAAHHMTGAVGQRRVPTAYVSRCMVPLPPVSEQRRIVTKIDGLLSELDKGIESLRTARAQLGHYRHALLRYAFEGKLTARWREENPDKLEESHELLGRVDREGGTKDGKKLARPADAELTELPPLPQGYVYTYLSNLGDLGRGRSTHRPRNAPELFGGSYPFIQTGEVKAANRIVREYAQTYSELGLQQSKLWPAGTLCITIAANIAETAILGFDACFPDSVVGFTPTDGLVIPEYVELFIESVRARIEAYAPATAQKNINLKTLENLVLPLCPLDEQRVLVDRLAAALSLVEEQQRTIDNELTRSDALREALLERAFSGRLVNQDPADEPASSLLERIYADRDAQNDNGKKKKATS